MISYRQSDDSLTGIEPVMSERQAAHYLGILVDDLRHQVNLGNLRFHGKRTKKHFVQRDLDAWKQAKFPPTKHFRHGWLARKS